jgi:hypothetical protein
VSDDFHRKYEFFHVEWGKYMSAEIQTEHRKPQSKKQAANQAFFSDFFSSKKSIDHSKQRSIERFVFHLLDDAFVLKII